MKLYTEEQVNKAIRFGFTLAISTTTGFKEYKKEFIDSLTSIELPSDEEIIQIALENTADINMQIAFNNGAVYICKLIEGQFNTKDK